jgi:HEAT repeat protein
MRANMRIILSIAVVALGLSFAGEAQAGRGSTYSQIRSAIQTGNADVITFELERAERIVCGACIEPVMGLLDSDDYRIREVAAWWFARRPAQKEELHDMAVARLYADDAVRARNAADWLGTFRHPKALPALAYAASRMDFPADTRAAAVRAMGTIGARSAEPAVVTSLSDPDAVVRLEAVRSYWALRGPRDGAPIAALVADADVLVRREAVAVVGHFRFAPARAALEQALASDPDALVRRNAAYALGKIGDVASRPALLAAMDGDSSSLVRGVAKGALANLR